MAPSRNNSAVGVEVHVDDEQFRKMSAINPNIAFVAGDAAKAAEAQRSQTLWQGIKLYRKAVGWSVLLSTAIIMEGFDIVLIANLLAVPQFKRKYGEQLPNGDYELSAAWQSGLTNGAYCGEIIGLMLNGWIADKYGFKKTMIGAMATVALLIFIPFFSVNVEMLLAGLILLGIPWGVFQTLTTTYAAEVCPVSLRHYLTTYVNLCWVIGQFLASAVLKGTSERTDALAYRIPYGLQWMWPVPLIIGFCFMPESPWWLVRHGRLEDAKKVMLRLTARNQQESFNADEAVAMMQHTDAMEKAVSEGTSYLDCFKRTDLRRTEITCLTWLVQSYCGSAFMGFSTYFYVQAGLSDSYAFTLSMVQYALGAVGVFCAWFLMPHFGRRTLYVWGLVVLFALLCIIGFCGFASENNSAAQWAIGSMLLVFTFVYDSTVGPVCYSLVAEMPSTRLRQKTVVLARNTYNIGSIITNILTPRMLNPTAWHWGAKSALFYAGTCLLCLVWTYFRLPEPKGRTYGELDTLFERNVSAWRHGGFAKANVDPYMTAHDRRASVTAEKMSEDRLADEKVSVSQYEKS